MEDCFVRGLILYSLWLLPVSWFDITRRRIPDVFSIGCLLSLIALMIITGCRPWLPSLVSAAAASGFLLLLRALTSRSIGLGDVKFAASSGALLPGLQWLPALSIASLSALLVFIPLLISGRIGRRFRVPFGPFIGIGTIAAALLAAERFSPAGF